MPKVSIIMPVYNKEKYIENTLNTICSQTYVDWELIVVNDGSTDESLAIIQNYAEKNKKISVYTQKNSGVSSARNLGLNKACGEWIWFIDADDVPEQGFLKKAMLYDSSDISIIVGNYKRIYPEGTMESVVIDRQGRVPSNSFPVLFMEYQYRNGYWGYLWNKLIRRELIEATGVQFKVGLTLAEDLRFMVELYRFTPEIYLITENAMNYTVDAINSSNEKRVDYSEQLNIQMFIYDWIIKSNNKIEYAKMLEGTISRYAAYIVFYSYEWGEDYSEKAKKIIDNTQVYQLLCYEGVESIMIPIVKALKKKNLKKLALYLKVRNIIRTIYRKITVGCRFG